MKFVVDMANKAICIGEAKFAIDSLEIFAQAPNGTLVRINRSEDGGFTLTRMVELERAIAAAAPLLVRLADEKSMEVYRKELLRRFSDKLSIDEVVDFACWAASLS